MQTAKLFQNGRSQAVRLPKNMRFSGTEVLIEKYDDCVILYKKPNNWDELFNYLADSQAKFSSKRHNPPPENPLE